MKNYNNILIKLSLKKKFKHVKKKELSVSN